MAGRAKENLPGGSLKYLFVYLKSVYLNVVAVVIITYNYNDYTMFRYVQCFK